MAAPFSEEALAALLETRDTRRLANAVVSIARELADVKAELLRRPTLRQVKVTAVNAGPPKTVKVKIDNDYEIDLVPILQWYSTTAAVNDGAWLLSMPNGKRFCIGDFAT